MWVVNWGINELGARGTVAAGSGLYVAGVLGGMSADSERMQETRRSHPAPIKPFATRPEKAGKYYEF
jgi:hypothetical protein